MIKKKPHINQRKVYLFKTTVTYSSDYIEDVIELFIAPYHYHGTSPIEEQIKPFFSHSSLDRKYHFATCIGAIDALYDSKGYLTRYASDRLLKLIEKVIKTLPIDRSSIPTILRQYLDNDSIYSCDVVRRIVRSNSPCSIVLSVKEVTNSFLLD